MSWRRLQDEASDVLLDARARPGRTALLIAGIALSVGVLVASLSVSAMAARQIDADVAASASRTFTVSLREGAGSVPPSPFPRDTDARAGRVPLVVAAGRRVDLPKSDLAVKRLKGVGTPDHGVTVSAVSAGYLRAAGVTTDAPNTFLLDHPFPYNVAFVGPGAARALGVPERGPYVGVRIWLDHQPFSVVGCLRTAEPVGLDRSVVVPLPHAETLAPVTPLDTHVLVRTEVGAGAPVARVIRAAIRPEAPESLVVSSVSDFTRLRTGVSDQLARLSAGVGVLLLVLAMLLIANSMVVSVISRTGEIGLRRSLGASRHAIARLFLLEGALAGSVGGLAGSATGVVAALVVAIVNDWTYRFPTAIAALAPSVGTLVAVLASAYPAWRAANVQPALALRSD